MNSRKDKHMKRFFSAVGLAACLFWTQNAFAVDPTFVQAVRMTADNNGTATTAASDAITPTSGNTLIGFSVRNQASGTSTFTNFTSNHGETWTTSTCAATQA